MSAFIGIPLTIRPDSNPIFEKVPGDVDRCIDNLLDLIVFTPKGSFHADPEFGFEYWNHEFSNLNIREFNNSYLGMTSDSKPLNDISKKQCEDSLKKSIQAYEPRLQQPEVKVELDINDRFLKKSMQSKYEMRIMISGFIDDGLGVKRSYEKRIAFMVEPVAKKISF